MQGRQTYVASVSGRRAKSREVVLFWTGILTVAFELFFGRKEKDGNELTSETGDS